MGLPTDYIPEPAIVLYGCRPLTPFIAGWHDRPSIDQHFHAPEDVEAGDRNFPREACPACKGLIGLGRRVEVDGDSFYREDARDQGVYCELCGSMAPRHESRALSARIGYEAKPAAYVAELHARHELKTKHGRKVLSEKVRRRIWHGCKGDGLSSPEAIENRAKVGREWLRSIGQEPDFDLILDARGRVIGRASELAANELQAAG